MKYFRLLLIAALAGFVLVFVFNTDEAKGPVHPEKINGVSFVAPVRPVEADVLDPVKSVNAGWVALMPFAFSQQDSPEIRFNHPRQWWGERREGIIATINHAHQKNLNVMLKPHVWARGSWVGDFELSDESAWKEWEKNYRHYALSYAKIADSLEVELFCIGTEFSKAANQRPDFWRTLISDIRSVYKGKLTYAANWDNYQNITFWSDLDYIGVDAYFPLSGQRKPEIQDLIEKWQPVKQDLQTYATQQERPILFTEFGYQSVDFTTDAHWKYERSERKMNLQSQAVAYRALFETFWGEPWFAGGFLWKWHEDRDGRGGSSNTRYTPQNKPAAQVIRHWYGK